MTHSVLKVKISQRADEYTINRLKRILNRDTRVTRRWLGILAQEYDNCFALNKKGKMVFSTSLIEALTMTTSSRKSVKYDLKKEFPRISHNELGECRIAALAQYKSHLALKQNSVDERKSIIKHRKKDGIFRSQLPPKERKQLKKLPKIAGFPKLRISKRKVARDINGRRFKIDIPKRMLYIIDSLDTNPKMIDEGKDKIKHDYLSIPLVLHKYHIEKLNDPAISVKTVRIIRKHDNFEAHFTFTSDFQKVKCKKKAVIGIDLGIKTDAFLSVLTNKGLSFQQSFNIDPELKQKIGRINDRVKDLQKQISKLKANHHPHKGLVNALKRYRTTRSELKFEANHQISAKIVEFIAQLSQTYDIYVALGDLTFLKRSTREKSRGLRRVIHPFTYYQLTQMIKHKLGKYKLDKRLTPIKEFYTSSFCWKCNTKGKRPKQDHFICINPACGWHGHADLNGSINIAKRLIAYKKLTPDTKRGISGLGKYLSQLSHQPQGQPAGKSQGTLLEYFEYDQPDSVYATRPGKTASVTSPT